MRRSLLRALRAVAATSLVAVTILSCDRAKTMSLDSIGQEIGLADPAPRPPLVVDVLCDRSDGASCTATTLRETFHAILPVVAGRSDSVVRGWMLGDDLATTALVGEQRAPSRTDGQSDRAIAAARDRFTATAEPYFAKAFESRFTTEPVRCTVLAEGITRIALTGAPRDALHVIVVVTDAWEVSRFADFECRDMPDAASFTRAIQRERVLAAGSLNGARVMFVYVELRPIRRPGCAVTPARALAARDVWTMALKSAGARDVTFSTGALDVEALTAGEEAHR